MGVQSRQSDRDGGSRAPTRGFIRSARNLPTMSLPDLLAEAVEGEDVVATVDIGGEDALVVTPSRTLVYRAEGLLSEETVEEYAHDVDRIDVKEGRRKAKLVLDYAIDGQETVTVPSKRLDDVLHPVLAGVLSATGITDPGESALRTFRFSELTLVVTSDRLVKHIGASVWDQEYEEFHYGDVTDLDFEEGTVATSIVLTHGGRQERFKAPNEDAPAVRRALTDALCAFHDVESLAEFRVTVADETEEDDAAAESTAAASTTEFSDGLDPLSASPATEEADADGSEDTEVGGVDSPDAAESAGADARTEPDATAATGTGTAESTEAAPSTTGSAAAGASGAAEDATATEPGAGSDEAGGRDSDQAGSAVPGGSESGTAGSAEVADAGEAADSFGDSGFEPAGVEEGELAAEVAELRETVEAQTERLDRQAELIEKLVEELRRGR